MGDSFNGVFGAADTQPIAPVIPGRSSRIGFVVDVVRYGKRSAPAQERIQHRLQLLLRSVVYDVARDVEEVDLDSGSGDGMVVFLPSGDDACRLVPDLLRSAAGRLAADNAVYRDRMRLRMAVGCGVAGGGATGFSGPLVLNIGRLVDSDPLRRVARDNPGSDLVALVLDAPHRDVLPGFLLPRVARLQLVDIAMKEFAEPAWLWLSVPARGQGR